MTAGSQPFDEIQDRGFYSLLFLAQAFEKFSLTSGLQVSVVTANMQDVSGVKGFHLRSRPCWRLAR